MKIEVGDRVTYDDGYIELIFDNEEINYQTVIRDRKISKIEKIILDYLIESGYNVISNKKIFI